MYSLVLLAAMTGAGEAPATAYYTAFDLCCPCDEGYLPQGGVVIFFWNGPAALSGPEEKEWQDYLALLESADKTQALDLWNLADRAGKQKLLAQVRAMKPKDGAPDKADK